MIRLVKTLFGWLVSRWFVSLVGLVLLSALIWFFGHQLAYGTYRPFSSETSRLILIIAIVFLWGIYNLVAALRKRSANAKVIDALQDVPQAAAEDPRAVASREETERLRERFADALKTLKHARLGRRGGRRYLYQLPWYVIIGPSGVGKTTALANSGLRFPLEDKFGRNSVDGVGGTRDCSWFFTDQAVLIDTAGRYATHDSDETVDRSAWRSFLELLRRHRPLRPIDGIIVAFSIADLTSIDQTERLNHARAVKRRVQEIYSDLRLQAPVYVLFTKCDLIAGFSEFFGRFSAEDRAQVWGVTFPLALYDKPNQIIEAFPAELDTLIDRLQGHLIPRLEEESDVTCRSLILSFSQQLLLLRTQLQEFLSEALGQTRFEEPIRVRGIYFSSATQVGNPIDRVIGSVASAFGIERKALPAFSGRERSYFLSRLLTDVIFREAGLVTRTGFFNLNRHWFVLGTYGAMAAVAGAVIALLTASFFANRDYIAEVESQTANFEQSESVPLSGRGSMADILRTLTTLRTLANPDHQNSGFLPVAFGMDQSGKLGEGVEIAYRRALNSIFVPRLMARLEAQIAQNLNHSEYLYQALKVYLMLTTPERRDTELVKLWISRDWNREYPGAANSGFRREFDEHLQALFEGDLRPVPEENTPLVKQAQLSLLRAPLASRAYAQLKTAKLASLVDPWRLADHVPPGDLRLFSHDSEGVPAFFTVKGYKDLFLEERSDLVEELVADTWVLGQEHARITGGNESREAARKIEELYLNDYIAAWKGFLDSLKIVPFYNIEQQATLVQALASPASPLKAVLSAVSAQTALSTVLHEEEEQAPQPGTFQKLRKRFDRLLGPVSEGVTTPTVDPTKRVDNQFEHIHALIRQAEGAPAPIDAVLLDLNMLYEYLVQVQQSGQGGSVQQFGSDYAAGQALLSRLKLRFRSQPEPVRGWLVGLLSASKSITIDKAQSAVRQEVVEVWGTNFAPECIAALHGRYPFAEGSFDYANPADFERILGPRGLLEQFSQQYIEPFADVSRRPWRWKPESAGSLGLAPQSLAFFESAAHIRQAFFPRGGPQMQVNFEVEPKFLDVRAMNVTLRIGNQEISYGHGPRRPVWMQWPPPSGAGASVVFTPLSNPGSRMQISQPGPWGFFRLLDQSTLERNVGGDRFEVKFDAGGYEAVFSLRTESIVNPFNLQELKEFRCLEAL